MKKHMMTKLKIDLTTTHCLFSINLEENFNHHEIMNNKSNNKFYHLHSTRRIEELVCTDSDNNVTSTATITKNKARWHMLAGEASMVDASGRETASHAVDECANACLIFEILGENDKLKMIKIDYPQWYIVE